MHERTSDPLALISQHQLSRPIINIISSLITNLNFSNKHPHIRRLHMQQHITLLREGHMSKQYTKPKRKRDAEWFKDKVLLVQAKANGQVLQEEELEFLVDPGTVESSSNQTKEESRNIDKELALEKQVKELNNIVFKRSQSAQNVHMLTKPQVFYNHSTRQALGFQNPCYLKKAQQLKPKLYDGRIIEKSNAVVIPDTEETLMLAEESRSKMIKKQKDPQMTEKKGIGLGKAG
nr:hypothetical protein [Tanacetum cinerariifolium]